MKFAAYDLQLFLDTHPDDSNALNDYVHTVQEAKRLEMQYEKMYGPLKATSAPNCTPFAWVADPWPWERMTERRNNHVGV